MNYSLREVTSNGYRIIIEFHDILRVCLGNADPREVVSRELGNRYSLEYKRALALGFHKATAAMIRDVCLNLRDREKISNVALAGGVFQNKVLTEMTSRLLRDDGFVVYRNLKTPPNNASISLGQAFLAGQME
jgi:hydrogenase maturation factor HypF (carbamoyltransferase family)